MSDLHSGERQVAETLDGIRRDHRARYEWAAARAKGHVVDVGCGIGYGSAILADAGHKVRAVDRSRDAIAFGEEHYARDDITWSVCDVARLRFPFDADAVVAFEIIEHLPDPLPALEAWRAMAPMLYLSVPNEAVLPYNGYTFHHRHYTAPELERLLNDAGYEVQEWWGQAGPDSEVEQACNGRTLVVVARRAERPFATETWRKARPVPERVAIVAMGGSRATWLGLAVQAGHRRRVADEVWAVNAMAGVIQHDRMFAMDDLRIQEMRAEAERDREPMGEQPITAALEVIRKHPGPVYTSRAYPDYPGTVDFPLAEVLTTTKGPPYLNNTAAYPIAYAMHLGVKEIQLYGLDYSYPDHHKRERGRACVEFWLGLAAAAGIRVVVAGESQLMDACMPVDHQIYGYDTQTLSISQDEDGNTVVEKRDRERLPTLEEINRRYSHDPKMEGTP